MIENNNKKVFDHDWFAIPFLITTCQPNGIFDTPDWATFKCVIRKFSHLNILFIKWAAKNKWFCIKISSKMCLEFNKPDLNHSYFS